MPASLTLLGAVGGHRESDVSQGAAGFPGPRRTALVRHLHGSVSKTVALAIIMLTVKRRKHRIVIVLSVRMCVRDRLKILVRN